MILCAFDCSARLGSVALFEGTTLLAERDDLDVAGKGERVMDVVREIVGDAARVQRWAVGLGPGSMTGARVAVAFVKGVALVTGAEVVGVTSFDAMDHGVSAANAAVCTVLRALPGEYYVRVRGHAHESDEPRIVVQTEVPQLLSALGPGASLVGDAEILHAFYIDCAAVGKGVVTARITVAPHDRPHARRIGEIAARRTPDDLEAVVPLYVMPARVTLPP